MIRVLPDLWFFPGLQLGMILIYPDDPLSTCKKTGSHYSRAFSGDHRVGKSSRDERFLTKTLTVVFFG